MEDKKGTRHIAGNASDGAWIWRACFQLLMNPTSTDVFGNLKDHFEADKDAIHCHGHLTTDPPWLAKARIVSQSYGSS